VLCSVDLALWDLAGRSLGQPVHRLLGAVRDKVPAYASTMCGDELPGDWPRPKTMPRLRFSHCAYHRPAGNDPQSQYDGERRNVNLVQRVYQLALDQGVRRLDVHALFQL
jgi:L-alanine-DL-glutamate epimerase-like enolase superfamily enzyme